MSEGSSGGWDSRSGELPDAEAGGHPRAGAAGKAGPYLAQPAGQPGAEPAGPGPAGSEPAGSERAGSEPAGSEPAGSERGDVYGMYRRAMNLLGRGSPAAAAQLLERAAAAEPDSHSILEALARAQFDTQRYADAVGSFRRIVEVSPTDDYAQFGLGLALARTGNHGAAVEHLALAAAMRPDLRHYTDALRGVRATLRARSCVRSEEYD
ncbi:MAG: tetratricopeptide repeat protein [Streptosporangiaceae bacterium]